MAKIRDAATLLGMLDDGQLMSDLSAEITETQAAIETARAGRKKTKVTGSVTLKIKFSNDSTGSFIDVELESKRPKKLREPTFLFVEADGTLLNENPKQADMFGPREVAAPRVTA